MCEFCLKHGEGKKWYLQAKNYSDDLLSDSRRCRFIESFMSDTEPLKREMQHLDRLERAPKLIRSLIQRMVSGRMKRVHFGQVVPIEDMERIFGMMNSIVRVACVCRHVTLGKEKRYCYGVSLSPDGGKFGQIVRGLDKSYLSGPDMAGRERLSREQAVAALREHEQEGLCHTVWTFRTPFIGAVCNCDRTDCLAMRCTITHGMPLMFRAEYVAQVDADACVGCRQCMRVCQFGAMSYSPSNQKVSIDQRWCYGCGICRSACAKNAIHLHDRAGIPAAANRW
jgi:Pyruvate/2-oxoacid:ferredoxin oxidoreductase delta subunit